MILCNTNKSSQVTATPRIIHISNMTYYNCAAFNFREHWVYIWSMHVLSGECDGTALALSLSDYQTMKTGCRPLPITRFFGNF